MTSKVVASLDPKDYVYAQATPELFARERQLLAAAACSLQPKPHSFWARTSSAQPAFQFNGPSSWSAPKDQRSAALAVPSPTTEGVHYSSVAEDDEEFEEPCMELDDLLMHDLFGTQECPASPGCYSKPGMDSVEDRSSSDASTATMQDEDCVDLLFSDSGPWRECMGMDWHHGMGLATAAGMGCGASDATSSPPGPFLKLNHEATAMAINCVLHKPV